MFKPLRVLGVIFALVLLTLLQRSFTPVSASSALESRISRLESDNSQLRSQVSRLESELYRLAGTRPQPERVNQPAPRITPNPSLSPLSTLGDDPMFKRLATLVIELKERIVALETQVAGFRR